MSFLRPLSEKLVQHNNGRVPVNSILSDVAIQHIMQFPDEKIQQMEDNETTKNWGNVLLLLLLPYSFTAGLLFYETGRLEQRSREAERERERDRQHDTIGTAR
mgnify:CR=1 FL=1